MSTNIETNKQTNKQRTIFLPQSICWGGGSLRPHGPRSTGALYSYGKLYSYGLLDLVMFVVHGECMHGGKGGGEREGSTMIKIPKNKKMKDNTEKQDQLID